MAEGKVEKGPVGFVRLTESSATYLGTGPVSYLGRQWTKLAGGYTRNMAVEHERQDLERLWSSLHKDVKAIRDGTMDHDSEIVRRFTQLDNAMRQSGWKPSPTPPPAPAASPEAPSASVTPHPSVPGPLPQPSTPEPKVKTPDPRKPDSPQPRDRAKSL